MKPGHTFLYFHKRLGEANVLCRCLARVSNDAHAGPCISSEQSGSSLSIVEFKEEVQIFAFITEASSFSELPLLHRLPDQGHLNHLLIVSTSCHCLVNCHIIFALPCSAINGSYSKHHAIMRDDVI